MSGDHDKYHGTTEVVKNECDGVYLTPEEMNEMLLALGEAVYLLNPTDEDMQNKAGVYRVVTALEKLKNRRPATAKREWVGLTDEERSKIHNDFIHKKIGIWEVCNFCEAKLKEKNT